MQMSAPGLPKGQISAKLYQAESESTPAKKATATGGSGTATSAFGMQGDPSQPIDIDADTLDVDDKKKVAIFRGKVRAVHGEYTITTEELQATYSGEAGMTLGPAPAGTPPSAQAKAGDPKAADAKTAAQLQKIVAPKRIDIVSKDGQRARGNAAVFDTKTNTATLTGDVVLARGTSTTNGNCALLDMGTGSMKLIDVCGSGGVGSAAAPASAAANVIVRGRAQALFYPGQMKDEQKAQREKPKQASPAAAVAPTPTATPTPPPQMPAAAVPSAPPQAQTVPQPRSSRPSRYDDAHTPFPGNSF
jgi:lipopolysaccharide export system protein LptA